MGERQLDKDNSKHQFGDDYRASLVYHHRSGIIVQTVQLNYFWVYEISRDRKKLFKVGKERRVVERYVVVLLSCFWLRKASYSIQKSPMRFVRRVGDCEYYVHRNTTETEGGNG
jgi:hypothetical protein